MGEKKRIQSSIESLSVGDERRCFNQIRRASTWVEPETLLWNGWPAGKFALEYVIGHHTKRKKKAELKASIEEENTGEEVKKKRTKKRNADFDNENQITEN